MLSYCQNYVLISMFRLPTGRSSRCYPGSADGSSLRKAGIFFGQGQGASTAIEVRIPETFKVELFSTPKDLRDDQITAKIFGKAVGEFILCRCH